MTDLRSIFLRIIPAAVLLQVLLIVQLPAQPVPQITAVSVEDNTTFAVYWEAASGTFDGYRVFYRYAGSTSPYQSADFPSSGVSGNIVVPDAGTSGYEFFMVTYLNSGSSSGESARLRSIVPVVSNAGSGTGIARIDWNKMNSGASEVYDIYRSDDGVSFSFSGSANQQVFFDTIQEYCSSQTIQYKIVCRAGDVSANSAIASGVFKDDNLPEDPELKHVTIVNGQARLFWTHSPSQDVDRYVIEVNEGGIWSVHETIGYSETFIDGNTILPTYHNPCGEVVTYAVRALDQCGNSSSGYVNYSKPHNTIFLTGDTEPECNRKASLVWNAYNNLNPPVTQYKVFRSHNGAPAVEIAALPAGSSGPYSFTDPELLTPLSSYTYRIQADNGALPEGPGSCSVELIPDPELLDVFELDNLTVVNSDYIDLFVNGDPPGLIHRYEIYRSADGPASLSLLGSGSWGSSGSLLINEPTAEVEQTSYYYKVAVLDACGYELASSAVMRSILLEITDLGEGNVRLNWNALEGWSDSPAKYRIYRFENDQPSAGFPVEVAPAILSFNDQIDDNGAGRVSYLVEAVRSDDVSSRSNTAVITGEADVVLPTAFRPSGLSPLFRPLVKNIDPVRYSFIVYNRWGQQVFLTNVFAEGWDGRQNGREAPAGIYAVIVTYADYNGNTFSKTGTLMLLR